MKTITAWDLFVQYAAAESKKEIEHHDHKSESKLNPKSSSSSSSPSCKPFEEYFAQDQWLRPASLYQLVGPPGYGKVPLILDSILYYLLTYKELAHITLIYSDIGILPDLIWERILNQYEGEGNIFSTAYKIQNQISIYFIHNEYSLLALLAKLPEVLDSRKMNLICIDSIASCIRQRYIKQLPEPPLSNMLKADDEEGPFILPPLNRQRAIYQVVLHLRKLLQDLGCSIIATNHLIFNYNHYHADNLPLNNEQQQYTTRAHPLEPVGMMEYTQALGQYWESIVTKTFYVDKTRH